MRFFAAICLVALTATPALARDHHPSIEPVGLMYIPPAASSSATIPPATNAMLAEIERKADLARVKSDAFDQRIRESGERAIASICRGCLPVQAKVTRVRVRLAVDAADTDRTMRSPSFRSVASALHRRIAMRW